MTQITVAFAIALAAGILAGQFILDSPDRDIERWSRELALTLPEAATKEDVTNWLTANGMTPHFNGQKEGQQFGIWAHRYESYFLHWDGNIEFCFLIGKNGVCVSREVQWGGFGP